MIHSSKLHLDIYYDESDTVSLEDETTLSLPLPPRIPPKSLKWQKDFEKHKNGPSGVKVPLIESSSSPLPPFGSLLNSMTGLPPGPPVGFNVGEPVGVVA